MSEHNRRKLFKTKLHRARNQPNEQVDNFKCMRNYRVTNLLHKKQKRLKFGSKLKILDYF